MLYQPCTAISSALRPFDEFRITNTLQVLRMMTFNNRNSVEVNINGSLSFF